MAEIFAQSDVSDGHSALTDLIHSPYRSVGAAVVDEEYLHVPAFQLSRGGPQTFDKGEKVVGLIVHRDDDRETSLHHSKLIPHFLYNIDVNTCQLNMVSMKNHDLFPSLYHDSRAPTYLFIPVREKMPWNLSATCLRGVICQDNLA